MHYRQILVLLTLINCVASACFEKDKQVSPFPGQVTTISDSNQVYQSYFDLETDRVVKSFRAGEWQLGFECGASGWHIITSSGGFWFIYNTHQTQLDQGFTIPLDVTGMYDRPSAFPDSTAVGNWVTPGGGGNIYTNDVYLLGHQNNGSYFDVKQVIFLALNDTAYKFFYKDVSDNYSDTVTILKNDSANFVYYSFNTKHQVNLEPNKNSYDLVFSPYFDLATLFGTTIPYHVGGSYINIWNTSAVLDSTASYNGIDYESLPGLEFASQRNIPGYLWKDVNVDVTGGGLAYYKVKTNYTYVFHTAQNNYFKLRFLSYSLNGDNGFPRFEYQQLKTAVP